MNLSGVMAAGGVVRDLYATLMTERGRSCYSVLARIIIKIESIST